jgi:hypothetical protein
MPRKSYKPEEIVAKLRLHDFPSASNMFRELVPGLSFRLARNSKVK